MQLAARFLSFVRATPSLSSKNVDLNNKHTHTVTFYSTQKPPQPNPTNTPSKTITHRYTYDAQGNIKTEFRSGAGGQPRFNLTHSYDALNRLTGTTGDQGYSTRAYEYDSLGNLIYERVHNKGTEYWHNNLNQQIKKEVDGKDVYTYSFDNRGNQIEGIYHQNQNHSYVVESYVYDSTNRMVKGANEAGEESQSGKR